MAGQTIVEKIIARHASTQSVTPDQVVWVDADLLLTHDVCGPGTISILRRELGQDVRVWDRERVIIIPDHFIFTEDKDAKANLEFLDRFAQNQSIRHYYRPGTDSYRGVCHVALAEEGHTRPGEIIFGTDSHTCTAGAFGLFATGIGNTDAAFVMGTGKLWLKVPASVRVAYEGALPSYLMAKDLILALAKKIGVDGASYMAIEFQGSTIKQLNIPERMSLCNMAIETGAKTGIIEPDEVTREFVSQRTTITWQEVFSDPDAQYQAEYRFDVSALAPQVAKPHSPDNVEDVDQLIGTPLDRCYIGSCTGGKTEDFRRAAEILQGKKVRVDTYCVPATVDVDKDLDQLTLNGQSLREILLGAGAQIGPPSCAACLGGPIDTFGRLNGSEVCLSTTNRNFPGRMGSPHSQVYLASPITVAASAVSGSIADPREFL